MAAARTIRASGVSVDEYAARVDHRLGSLPDVTVTRLGTDHFQVSESHRPTWTIVLAVVLFPVGLLFLLVRDVRTATVRVGQDARAATVTISGVLADRVADALESSEDPHTGEPANAATIADGRADDYGNAWATPLAPGRVTAPARPTSAAAAPPEPPRTAASPPSPPPPDDLPEPRPPDPTRAAETPVAPPPATSPTVAVEPPTPKAAASAPAPPAPAPPPPAPPSPSPSPSGTAPTTPAPSTPPPTGPPPPPSPNGHGVVDPADDRTVVRSSSVDTSDKREPRPDALPRVLLKGGAAMDLRTFSRLVFGRDPVADAQALPMSLSDDNEVSKTHATIEFDGDEVWLSDLHSTNGTWVLSADEHRRLEPGERHPVRARTTVRLGTTDLIIEPF